MHKAPLAGRDGDLLSVRDLRVEFPGAGGTTTAVDGVSLSLGRGETLGLVGESGSGKTSLALSILGLLPPPGRVVQGSILFEGRDLLTLSAEQLRRIRGGGIGIVFQEPGSAVDPLMRVSAQMIEAVRAHESVSRAEARAKCRRLLSEVGISDPESCLESFPHQLSGGMLQRVLIAIALSCGPSLIIGDEPTSSLDVTVQAQILELLRDLRRHAGLSMLLISHDLGVVAQLADRVAVLYRGQIVEIASVQRLFAEPSHPYTRRLLALAPGHLPGRRWREYADHPGPLAEEPGPPSAGCRYRESCPEAVARCREEPPELLSCGGGGWVRCLLRADLSGPPSGPSGGRAG